MGLGTLVLLANAALLWLYSLSCHSCRHIVGGRLNHFSRHPVRYRLWTLVSRLNGRHMQFAWALAVQRRDRRRLRLPAGHRHDLRPAVLLTGGLRWSWNGTSTTSWSSERAAPVCGRRSRPTRAARAPPSSASPCWARRTRSWPRAASPRPWPTSTPRTTGGCTSATPCAAGRCSTTGGWRSCTPRRRPTGSASSRTGARCSTARRTA